ncbi:MAG TPA: hypothetical protein VMD91_01045 [Candidatus Sulfotelmatobacter sp.]|nr:hypothetical protein [Candidatus Sulfotelmatobacter sp.]
MARTVLLGPAVFLALLIVCGAESRATASAPLAQLTPQAPGSVIQATGSVETLFDKAQNLKLTSDADYAPYIDGSITGSDRALAIRLMRLMPPAARGDFIYVDEVNDRIFSNNPALAARVTYHDDLPPLPSHDPKYLARKRKGTTFARPSGSAAVASKRSPLDMNYSNTCSPPQPFEGSGPYARLVSQCSFTGAIGFVDIECGYSDMDIGDSGNTYFEVINGHSQNAQSSEGGLTYYTDNWDGTADLTGIAPYYRNSGTGKYTNLNANGFHYDCGEVITIAHGPVVGTGLEYTFTGLPSGYNPYTYWAGQIINFDHPAWEFDKQAPNWGASGKDSVGVPTPCTQCSIAEVTSIATECFDENGQSYACDVNDGSVFGVTDDGRNAIAWNQVGFGDWLTGCNQNASVCTLEYSTTYTNYYGGLQEYDAGNDNPDIVAVNGDGPNPTSYGPWQTYVGIALPDDDDGYDDPNYNTARGPAGSFTSSGPPTCTIDSYGYCFDFKVGHFTANSAGTVYYYIENAQHVLLEYSVSRPDTCPETLTWSPAEPKVALGDPNLP